MMKKKFIMVKNTKIYILLGFLVASCSVTKKIMDRDTLGPIINDYIIDFNRFSINCELKSLLIYIDSIGTPCDNIIIQDYPLEHLYQDIINKEDTAKSIAFGSFNGTPTKMICNDVQMNKFAGLLQYDSLLIERAHRAAEVFDENGKKLNVAINGSLMQYEPILISTYNIYSNTKKMEVFDGKIVNDKFSIK